MKLRFTRPSRLAAIGLGLGLILIPVAVHAATEPYFKVFGADVMSGGWFANAGSCDTTLTGPYQDPNYAASPNPLNGGIVTYENYNRGGAGSQFGAFALGQVEGSPPNNYGFYTQNSFGAARNKNKGLTFANTSQYGGNYEGASRQSNCIPDYYSRAGEATPGSFAPDGGFPSDGAYQYTPSTSAPVQLFNGPVSINPGSNVTIFIKGNVWISDNITYQPDTADNTTKFALVVSGNIFISPNVSRLDGLYIAQPQGTNPAASDGEIWTCHDKSTDDPVSMPYVWKNCTGNLVVNGSLIAKQVNFLRIPGDVNAANSSDNSFSTAGSNIAEVINYTPEMVVGGPFFSTTRNAYTVQSLTSLPPLF